MAKLKPFGSLFILLLFMLSIFSCLNSISGDGELTFETRNIQSFARLQVDLDATVILTDSLAVSCMVSAQENLMPVIETKLKGDRLIIYSEKNIRNSKPITIYLSVNRLADIELNGSGNITSTNILKSGNLELSISGSGNIKMAVVCDRLRTGISGSGKLELEGRTNESDFDISGSGVIEAFNLPTGNCNVDISGSGQAHVFPAGVLKAEVSGSGNIRYKGNPADIIPSISGSGSIEKSE